ncbi:hypothetical protein VTL71DRAFT_5192 [Oculimacula yallundae]|uniref:Uncharacterized protein n=1 Tax=Oculimacula yallundae TaxID=86028 RepID=A0ABR4C115_9HELO
MERYARIRYESRKEESFRAAMNSTTELSYRLSGLNMKEMEDLDKNEEKNNENTGSQDQKNFGDCTGDLDLECCRGSIHQLVRFLVVSSNRQ